MRIIRVNLKKRSYDIIIGPGLLKHVGRYIKKLNIGSDAFIITNARIKNKYGSLLSKSLQDKGINVKFKLVADSEKSKSISVASGVIRDIANFDKKRKIFIIAFGGGVIGDLAGFVASVYKRGIAYVQVPTTLLAQVDSAIGGKTAVDLIQGKNLVGAIYQPKAVFSDVSLLKSLDIRQLKSGLGEVIKYGVIKDPVLFAYLEKKYKNILRKDTGSLMNIVWRCSLIKARIVEQDEKEEKGIRTVLNFGHTLGHAIEAAAGFKKYNHGEAVALGMLMASVVSKEFGLTNDKLCLRIENLIRACGLPEKIQGISTEKIIKAYYRDKKFIGAKNRLVLVKNIGTTKIAENIPLEIIKAVLKKRV
ncbi:MAG: 3-dehydroquinate synthase [Candidatus Omnitrophica bacterium]|jgi:3-dehydroquinate synthase|nr:3-dehydroquinate synthase [Candidatus Omnitrophota bacterium]